MIIMKTKFLFAMCAIAASFALISCSDEQLLTEDIIEPEVPYTGPVTVFSSVAETPQNSPFGPNRTSAARYESKFPFYWTKNDRIWVKNTNNKFYESHTVKVDKENEPTEKVAAGYFDIHGSFKEESYQVFYLGQAHNVSEGNVADGIKEPDVYVTIAKEQGQMKVEHMDHFGVAGDCGTATAYKQEDGTYQFVLNHKASYLAIYPTKHSDITKNITISKLEITADDTDLAGDFHFSDGSLKDETAVNNGSRTIYFKTGTGEYEYGFPLEATNNKEKGIYVVIPPGTHKLSLKFYLFDEYHRKAEVTKTYNPYEYKENTFVNLKPTLKPEFPNELVYENVWYQWDAQYPYNPQYTSPNFNGVSAPNSASYSCKYMPNANELWWYIKNGDVRWDGTTTYTVKYKKKKVNGVDITWNDVEETLHGGIWIKRKAAILAGKGGLTKCGHASHGGNGPYMCEDHCYYSKAINGQNVPGWYDFRVDDNAHADFNSDYSPNYNTGGKPAENIEDYFFLPALGYFDSGSPHFVENEYYDGTYQSLQTGYYWARNPAPVNGNQKVAYYLMFNANGLHVNESIGARYKGFVAGDEWFH